MSGRPLEYKARVKLWTQRVLVPGGEDRVTSPPIGKERFHRMKPDTLIWLRTSTYVLRSACFWNEEQGTISLCPGLLLIDG